MQALPEKDQTLYSPNIDSEPLDEIFSGLTSSPKRINSKYFYDEYGSKLFDQITLLDEYYPTRTELSLLNRFATEIKEIAGQNIVLLEPGAGSCTKIRHLLPVLRPVCYVPIDISADYLFAAAEKLQREFEDIDVYPIADDMQSAIQLLPEFLDFSRMVFYPGSTIGNYTPEQAIDFLRHVRRTIGNDGSLLIGVDLQKDTDVLHRAYNDASGTTAAFNLNCLNHINAVTDANFDLTQFRHVAFYNEQDARIEMHLESQVDQLVMLAGQAIPFNKGERILTEYSYKYTVDGFAELAAQAGLVLRKCWTDDEDLFSLQYYSAI
ncbi:MAG: L-histidine N(alpha)-methyltransferase [Pseudomonadales bacterium]